MDYCKFSDCPYHGCENHQIAMPEGEKVTEEAQDRLRKECIAFREREEAEAKERVRSEIQRKIKCMTYGDAFTILGKLEDPDTPDELKGAAIRKAILNLETHNSVTKVLMVKVIRYLFGLCFEELEG